MFPTRPVEKGILGPLVAYNESKTGRNDIRPLVIALDDSEGRVIGGLCGRTAYDWLFVELLFVPDSLRGRGVGTDLMKRAEIEALARGCHSAWLDTFEFQALGFYERLGYTCFGELSAYPAGARRFFMKKALHAG
jgi:GNAT superfamily N-acetyltransferase